MSFDETAYMVDTEVLLIRAFLAVIVGGLIGAEREYRSKFAGFRTMILICLGSFLFTTFGIHITGGTNDRIASNIVTGIGFIGAGVIFQSENRINGLTTAATIWAVAALGMGIADGQYVLVLICTFVILISLLFLTRLENLIDNINQSRTYKLTTQYRENLLHDFENLFKKYGLTFKRLKQTKNGSSISGMWIVKGSQADHEDFIRYIFADPEVTEFEF